MRESKSPLPLSHEQAVAKLNQTVSDIHAARRRCHDQLRHLLADGQAEHIVDGALATVDEYGATLESYFNALIELKVLHPAAWDASEGGRLQRAHDEELRHVIADSLALVMGLRCPDGPALP